MFNLFLFFICIFSSTSPVTRGTGSIDKGIRNGQYISSLYFPTQLRKNNFFKSAMYTFLIRSFSIFVERSTYVN
jgi:hypothetical protein